MSRAETALTSNANSAPPTTRAQSTWTLKQEELAREFVEAYGLDRKQISFEGASEQPIFDFDALSILSLRLTDIPDIRVEPGDFHNAAGIATAICRITLRDLRAREVYGNCLVGEVMYDGTEVADIGQALKIAQARALRTGLRAVGFDPFAHTRASKWRVHSLRICGQQNWLNSTCWVKHSAISSARTRQPGRI